MSFQVYWHTPLSQVYLLCPHISLASPPRNIIVFHLDSLQKVVWYIVFGKAGAFFVAYSTRIVSINAFHILTCPCSEARKVWETSLESFIKGLTHLNTDTELFSTLTYDLHCWRHSQPYLLIQSLSTTLQPIFIHLWQTKYDKFLEGLIPKAIILHQERCYREQNNCRETGKTWGKKVYKLLWEFTKSIWVGHNQQLHETDRIKELQAMSLVLQAISRNTI